MSVCQVRMSTELSAQAKVASEHWHARTQISPSLLTDFSIMVYLQPHCDAPGEDFLNTKHEDERKKRALIWEGGCCGFDQGRGACRGTYDLSLELWREPIEAA